MRHAAKRDALNPESSRPGPPSTAFLLAPFCRIRCAHKKTLRPKSKGFKNLAIPTFTLVCTIIGSQSLTSVFGMGTGITFAISSPERLAEGYFASGKPGCSVDSNSYSSEAIRYTLECGISVAKLSPVSIGLLNTLPCLHFQPINLVVFQGAFD